MSSEFKLSEGPLPLLLSKVLPLPFSFPPFPLSLPPFPLPLFLGGVPTFFSLGLFFLFLNHRLNFSFPDAAFCAPITKSDWLQTWAQQTRIASKRQRLEPCWMMLSWFSGVLAKRVDFNVKSTEIIVLSARHEKQYSLCLKLLDAESIKFNTSKKFSASTTTCTICLSPHLFAAGTPISPPALPPRSGAMCLCRQAFPGIHGEQVENRLKDTDMGSSMSQTPTEMLRLPCWLASGNFWNLAIKRWLEGSLLAIHLLLSWTIYWSDWSELCLLPHNDLHWRIRMNESVVNTWLAASCYVNNFVRFCACVCNWWLDVLKNDILKSWGRLRSNDTTIALATGINYHSQ